MASSKTTRALLLALCALNLARAQLTQTVSVGTFYNPPLVAAPGINDTIVFLFMAGLHGVTQSSLEAPCEQLPGGFNSGLIKGDANNPPSWNLTVTNVSAPIWYMCQGLQPFSHCGNGMVGAINAPVDQYDNFTAGAKVLTSTTPPVTDMVLTGQGAFATNPPTTLPLTSVPATTTSTSSSASATQTQSSSKSGTSTAAIVGGAVGGIAVICALAAIIFFCCRSRGRRGGAGSGEREQDEKQQHHPIMKTEPFAMIETGHKFDGTDLESKNGRYFASQQHPGLPRNESSAATGLDGVGGMPYHPTSTPGSPGVGNGYAPTEQRLAYHNQMMMGGGAGGYARSEPASDGAQDREGNNVSNMPMPMAGPSSPNLQQQHHQSYFGGGSDPRFSSYSDPRSQHPQQQQYGGSGDFAAGGQRNVNNNFNVRDIAREVADLLRPHMRANETGSPPPSQEGGLAQQVNRESAANVGGSNHSDAGAAATQSEYGAPSLFATPEVDRLKSPAPPEYS